MVSIFSILALAGGYLLFNLLSLLFTYGSESVTVFWAGNGYLLAVLMLVRREWKAPLIALAGLAAVAANLAHGIALPPSLAYALVNILEIIIALRLTRGISFLEDRKGIVRFFSRVTLAAAAAGGLAGGAAVTFFFGGGFFDHAIAWFLVDAAGLAVMTPVLLAWARPGFGWTGTAWWRNLEFAAGLAMTVGLSWLVFRRPEEIWTALGNPMPYTLFPFLVWSAIRFGSRGSSTVVLVIYTLLAWCTSRGYGPVHATQQRLSHLLVPMHLFPYFAAFCSLLPSVLFHAQKKIELDLRRREVRFGNLWNSRLIGIYVADLGGVVREANDTFLAMVRHTREEMEAGGIQLLRMATPEYLAQAATNRARFEKDGQIGPLEREWILRDGTRFHSLIYATRTEDPNVALGMVMNMEELHATQGELRRRESRYRDLLSSTLIGIFVTDLKGGIIEANDTFLSLIKRTRAELEAGEIHSGTMVTPEYLAGAASRREIFRQEGKMGPFDREWVLADGSRKNTLFFATRMEENGNALCMVLDRDELKRTQVELRAVETRFKKLFEANIVGVAVSDDRTIREANDTFLTMVGYDRADLEAGRVTVDALRDPDSIPTVPAQQASIKAKGRIDPQETRYVRKDGSRVNVYRGVTLLDNSSSFLIIAIDITGPKRTQAELENAMAAAREADRAKSDFLAHMSHEIRTPMNGVLGMVSLLQGTRLDGEQQSYARATRESGEHLLGLINQILDFSKIESGTLEIDHSEFSLSAMLEGAFSPLLEKAQSKGLELVKRVDPEVPAYFLGDSMRLQQILLNLMGNAVKFSDRGEVSVSVRLVERKGSRCRLGFEVADQGPGIKSETLATLFHPFRQGDDTLSRKSGGTGLGLAISKELVSRMEGSITAESRPGAGSVFRFDVWLDEETHAAENRKGSGGGEAKPSVWILEPHPDHRGQLESMLAQWGFRVRTARAAEDLIAGVAADAAAGRPPAAAILSIPVEANRPEANAQAIAAVREAGAPILCSLPFITQGEGGSLLKAGADGILTKPFRGSDLYNALCSLNPDWTGVMGPGSRASESPAPMSWGEPPLVLVVDDHPVNLTVASSMLRKIGCRVETVADGPSALSAVAGRPFDMVFMDCQMPDMDGFETTRKLRGLRPERPRIPVVALTAHAVKGFREKCLAEGMDDYISKPFTSEELAAAMRKWIPSKPFPAKAPAGSAASGPAGCMDWSRLAMMDDGSAKGKEMVVKLIQVFLDTTRTGLDTIRRESQAGRKNELARALHKLKGGCGTIGATSMFLVIQDLESCLEAGEMADIPARIGKLESEFARTLDALRPRA